MKRATGMLAALVLLSVGVGQVKADWVQLITNGGFESGDFTGWTETNQAGGSGSWYLSSSTYSPLSGYQTPGPASGGFYAMTDQTGPGSHVLTQTFTVVAGSSVTLSFDMFSNDHDGGPYSPGGSNDLNYTVSPNEHARVDILTASASPFDITSGVVDNLYDSASIVSSGTNPWVHYSFDITSAVAAGGTFQIRFAEVDNQSYLQQGIDNVSILEQTPSSVAPAPPNLFLLGIGALCMGGFTLRRRKWAIA